MVIQGKKGSICFYFNNKLVGSLPLGKRFLQDYEKQRDILLREALEDQNFKKIKRIFWSGLHKFINLIHSAFDLICHLIKRFYIDLRRCRLIQKFFYLHFFPLLLFLFQILFLLFVKLF